MIGAGAAALMAAGLAAAGPAGADTHLRFPPSYSLFGQPGLIDMPSAVSAPDAEFAITASHFAGATRATLSFQITPRLTGSFRYASISPWPNTRGRALDRSFDIRFRLVDEGRWVPAVAVGLRDMVGTGIYSSEYLVATKHVGSRVRVTAGLGWGRLGGLNSLGSPFGARPGLGAPTGGTFNFNQWFRGPVAPFGGLEFRATDRLTLLAEYSSDIYRVETFAGGFVRRTPFNFGAQYSVARGINLGAYYLYGDTVGVSLNVIFNPRTAGVPGGLGPAPPPVAVRAPGAAADLGWTAQPGGRAILMNNLVTLLEPEGLVLEALTVTGRQAEVRVLNTRYDSTAQAIGRTARVMTRVLPASVETFVIVPVMDGIALSAVTLRRRDLETLEHAPDGSWQSYVRAGFADAAALPPGAMRPPELYPKFSWGLTPYLAISTFDPDDPLRYDVGVQLKASWEPRPGLVFATRVRKKVYGTLDQSTRMSDSVLPRVRSDANIYEARGDPAILELYGAHYFRPGRDLYGRVTLGYLERMYGGVSAELLWKPVDSRFAVGVEVNYVKQRAFDQLFGFQGYQVLTGHVSGYWDMGNGFHAQLDAGRYLAGDWGATLSLDREFANGWRIGAFATLTDVPFSRFGEGAFDKGLRFTVPISSLTGQPSKTRLSGTLRPILRDGGARLDVPGRLYESVREYHRPVLREQWGRFLR